MQSGLLKWSPCIPLILSIVKDLTPEKHKGLHKIILYKLGTSLKETMFNPNVFCVSSFHHDGFLQLSTQADTLLPSSSSLHRTSPAINHPLWLDAFLHLYFSTVFSIIGCGNERRCYHRDLGISDKSADQGDNQGVQRRYKVPGAQISVDRAMELIAQQERCYQLGVTVSKKIAF